MTRAADKQLPVFDRSGQGPLSNPDHEPSGIVGGMTRDIPSDDLDENLAQAENSRPDLPDETVDGLDDTEEEVRRQAEDLPLDTPGSLLMARDPDFDRISKKAHELWEADGRPHGRDQDHWDQAREIIAIQDSQGDTLLPRDTGAEEPIEEADAALRNLADFPNLTDQGENLLTSTDREPELTATPSGKKGRMPKVEVPVSDQPGIPPKAKKAAKSEAAPDAPAPMSSSKPAMPVSAPPSVAAQPKTASMPQVAKPETTKSGASTKKPAASTTKKAK